MTRKKDMAKTKAASQATQHIILTPIRASASLHIKCKPLDDDPEQAQQDLAGMRAYLERGQATNIQDDVELGSNIPYTIADISSDKTIYDTVRRAANRKGIYLSTDTSSDKRYETEWRKYNAH